MVKPFNSRNSFDLSHEHLLTCNMGTLVPCLNMEVTPGDVFRWDADMFMRLMPLIAPMMHSVDVYMHCFFVPTRLVFDKFEDFITGGMQGNDETLWPYVTSPVGGFAVGSLADYLGLPTGVAGLQVSALPFRAYDLIYNEWYRDNNLIDPIVISKDAGADTTTVLDVQRRAWKKDYFTGSLPWAQRGDATYLPLGVTAPVVSDGGFPTWKTGAAGTDEWNFFVGNQDQEGKPLMTSVSQEGQTAYWKNPGLHTDLSAATALSVNDLRLATQIQRFKEKNARGGARYIEWILSHFGVRSSDARLQRPEYLGGGRCPVSIGEVLQTSSTDSTSPQGNMAGRAVSAMSAPRFTKYFEEYGFVIGVLSVMPKAMYQQGIDRMWTRKTRYDYPLPVFAHLGNQAVLNKELYAQGTADDENTFGYQERYEELRRISNKVHGEFKSTLNYWHLGRIFDNLPQLNKDFVECNPSKRVFAVTDQSEDCCIVQVRHNIQAIRPFPKFGEPGYLDHD